MKIVWENNEFVAELTPGELWSEDKDAVQTAGFHTTGPPEWKWYAPAPGVKALDRLKQLKPKSGLLITELAFQHYKQISQQITEKEQLRKQFKKTQREERKKSPDSEVSGLVELVIPEKGYIDEFDLPLLETKWTKPVFPTPEVYCFVCGDPLYLPFPDYPDICIWCSKIQQEKT